MEETTADVVVVGAGNAGLCAALAAREPGVRVVVLEAAPQREQGGNSAFTAGAMRVVFGGVDDLRRLMPDLNEEQIAETDFGSYSSAQFMADMARVTEYRTDPDLAEILVNRSFETLEWMASNGVRFVPSYGRQAFRVDGKFKFWGGLAVETSGGGPGLIESLVAATCKAGVDIRYESRAIELLRSDGGIEGVRLRHRGKHEVIRARTVVLASGGFEANAEWRTRYLGPGWDLAKVRGTRFNQGDGIQMALAIGASPAGNWSGCHAVAWDLNAPEFGTLSVGDGFQKHSYPFGILVNSAGERFLDEGADFRNYTYAKYGRMILAQPGMFAFQVFDSKVSHLLRDEYRIREVTAIRCQTIEELANRMAAEGVDKDGFLRTIQQHNAAVDTQTPFDPNVKDGRRTNGLAINKSNWAMTIADPPFEAYAVTCGITFTFGGLRITPRAEVVEVDGAPIDGLYACGELVGGLFYSNYPGGTGLTAGAVFGRIAGAGAGRHAVAALAR